MNICPSAFPSPFPLKRKTKARQNNKNYNKQTNKQTNKNPGKCNKYNFSRIRISSHDLWKYIHNISYDKSGNEKNCS